jgi:hypothetical protein
MRIFQDILKRLLKLPEKFGKQYAAKTTKRNLLNNEENKESPWTLTPSDTNPFDYELFEMQVSCVKISCIMIKKILCNGVRKYQGDLSLKRVSVEKTQSRS